MAELYTDVLGFAEIGGVGEMIYHSVRFPAYSYGEEKGAPLLIPSFSEANPPEIETDYTLTGKKLLVSLCNLFRKINDPKCTEPYIDLIIAWCRENTHPYQIDHLYDIMVDTDFQGQIGNEGIFAIDDFVRDLSHLFHTFAFFHALEELKRGNDQPARELYYEGRFDDGYPFFEKYYHGRRVTITDEADAKMEELLGLTEYVGKKANVWPCNPLDELDVLRGTLLSLFPEFHMKLKVNPRTKRVVYAADVQSVFDICWYTLSRMVADDAPPQDTDADLMGSEGSVLSCLCCGSFFIRRSSTQKYCENPDCKDERNRRKARAYEKRKREQAKSSNAEK